MTDNDIEDEGPRVLCGVLTVNTTLTSLDLRRDENGFKTERMNKLWLFNNRQ